MDFYNEPLYRKDKKIGRNDPCHCGSGKKYKKCCMENDSYSPDTYISAHEYNFIQKENNLQELSSKEIWDFDSYELQMLNIEELNPEQLISAMRRSMLLDNIILAISFAKKLKEKFVDEDGKLYVKEKKIKLGVKKIAIGGNGINFDDYLQELVINIEISDKKDLVEQVADLYFNKDSIEYYYSQFLLALHKNDQSKILDCIERLAMSGIEDSEYLSNMFFSLREGFPGLALMAFRSVIAAFPNSNFDIDLMIDELSDFEEDPSLNTYDIICDFFADDSEKDNAVHINTIKEIQQELRNARKESARQQKIVEKLKKHRKTIDDPQTQQPLQDTVIDLNKFKDQIDQGKRKIKTLQGIIKNKQEAIKELKSNIPLNNKNSNDQDSVEIEENHEIDFDISTHIFPRISIPEYSKEFIKNLENEELAIARKALASVTAFSINDMQVLKQTKKLKSLENYYSIRVGIHHRLIIEYGQNRTLKARYLIHRKELEKIIKKIKESQLIQQ